MLDIKILNDAITAAGITLDVAVSENLDATFAELGLDSLDMFNLFLELETLTGISIPDEQVDNIKHFNDILQAYSQ